MIVHSIHSVLALGALLSCADSLCAALLVSDDFAYDNAALIDGLHGGSGWAGPWSGIGFITPGSLRFPQLAFTGNKATSQGSKCAFRKFAATADESLTENGKFGKDNTTLWISFLINAPAGTTIPGYGGISLFEEARERMFIGDTGASNVWAIERQGQTQRFSSRVADSNICFVVCRIQFLPGPDRIDLWIDPPSGVTEPAQKEASASIDNANDFRFDGIRFCSAPMSMNIDAFRMGTAYRDVAPRTRWNREQWLHWIPWITSYVLFFLLICALIVLVMMSSRRRTGKVS
jgi:hypothetical protein